MHGGMEYVDLGSDDPNVIGVRLSGKMTTEAMADLIEKLETIRAAGGKARLYADIVDYDGYEFGVVKEKLNHFGTLWDALDRCAYVVDKGWMTSAIGLVDAVTPMHLRAFERGQDAEARAWVIEGA